MLSFRAVVTRQQTPGEAGGSSDRPCVPWRAEWFGALVVFSLALVLRSLHYQQLCAHDPFFTLPSVDERMYHEWALAISSGDWLGDRIFLNGPLYPYFLAALYQIFGPGLAIAKAAQVLMGSGSCVLVWVLARRLFDARVALIAGVASAVYGMSIFYEGTLVVCNVQLFLALLILLAVVRALESPGVRAWLGAGVLVGLSVVARPNVLLFAALVVAWSPFALRHTAPLARRGAWVAAFGIGVMLAVLPVTLRNYVVGGEPVLVTHAGGLNFFLGNNPDANGSFRVPRIFPRALADDPWEQRAVFESYAEGASGRDLTTAEASAFWRDRGLDFIRAQPGQWFRLELRKLALSVNAFESWNIRSYTLTQDFSWVLRLPLLSFGVLAPIALFGIVLTRRDWRRLMPLYAMLGTVVATMLVFFVLSRYRMPAIPVLTVFAAAGVVSAWDALHRRQVGRVLLAAALAIAFGFIVNRTVLREDLSVAYYNLGNRYRELEKWGLAIDAYRESLRRNSGYLSAYNNLAIVLENSGTHDEDALRAWERVRGLGEARRLELYTERAQRHLDALRARTNAEFEPQEFD